MASMNQKSSVAQTPKSVRWVLKLDISRSLESTSSMSTEKSQQDRFKAAAREVGADESDDALDKVFGKLDVKRKPEEKPAKPSAKED